MTTSSSPMLRIGILGAANIARLFAAGVRPSQKVAVVAVAARDAGRARKFADETGITRVHPTYDALLADPAIDAIYNPLPNSLHAEWSIRALDAGKHVLCEKPLATSGQEARAMFDAAKRNDRHLAEAYPYRAQPQTLKLGELLHQNAIGRVQLIQASFGFPLADAANIRMNPALAGGALMDAGCYPVSFVRMVAGSRPARVQALAQWSDSGVDRTLVASLEFAGGLIAQISCTFATARHRHAFIAGDGARLRRVTSTTRRPRSRRSWSSGGVRAGMRSATSSRPRRPTASSPKPRRSANLSPTVRHTGPVPRRTSPSTSH